MAQRRAGAGGEHRGEPVRLLRERRVPDRVHAMSEPMEPPVPDTERDPILAQPCRAKLRNGHDPVLPSSDTGNGRFRGTKVPLRGTLVPHERSITQRARADLRASVTN